MFRLQLSGRAMHYFSRNRGRTTVNDHMNGKSCEAGTYRRFYYIAPCMGICRHGKGGVSHATPHVGRARQIGPGSMPYISRKGREVSAALPFLSVKRESFNKHALYSQKKGERFRNYDLFRQEKAKDFQKPCPVWAETGNELGNHVSPKRCSFRVRHAPNDWPLDPDHHTSGVPRSACTKCSKWYITWSWSYNRHNFHAQTTWGGLLVQICYPIAFPQCLATLELAAFLFSDGCHSSKQYDYSSVLESLEIEV